MSDDQVKSLQSLPSIVGYVNWRELRNIVIASNGAQLLIDALLIPVLQQHSRWLAEPWDTRLTPIFALCIALLVGKRMGRTYLVKGE